MDKTSGQVDSNMRFERLFFENGDFHADLRVRMILDYVDRRVRLKIASRPVQDGSMRDERSDAFSVLIFDSFWGRLGVVWAVVLVFQIDLK